MAFKRSDAISAAAGICLLLLIGGIAGRVYPEPRLLTLCALAALTTGGLLWRQLVSSSHASAAATPESDLGQNRDAMADELRAFETRLEHAPVALFGIGQTGKDDPVVPLNAMARRTVAPGRASDPAELYARLRAAPVGKRGMIDFETERGMERALASVNAIALNGVPQRLVALIPMESQLEAEALLAWRELAHVLTHEIMNSLTPVASLSQTARDMLEDLRHDLPEGTAADLTVALDTIGRRAGSLASFVASYRSLSNVPAPVPERMNVNAVYARLSALYTPAWTARGGSIRFMVEAGSLELMVDPGQFEQALINLIQNAADATQAVPEPSATVSAKLVRGGRLRVEVVDNGPGVPDNLIPQIFTPFFTTRERGSGIGLAMVRQLVHANGGTVRYAKSVGGGARFVVTF